MASGTALDTSNIGAVILHSTLSKSAIARLLCQKDVKIRPSERILEGSVIFSKAKLAFLILDISKPKTPSSRRDLSEGKEAGDIGQSVKDGIWDAEVISRIEKFIGIHRQCYVILQAPLFTVAEFGIVSQLQSKYLHQNVDFLPAHNAEDCVEAMLTLASVQTPPRCEILHQRFCDLMNGLLQPCL